MLQLREMEKGKYELVFEGNTVGYCQGDLNSARKYAVAMNAELVLWSKPEMPIFVATLKVIRETEIAVRFSMPSEDFAKEFLDEIAFDSDLDLGECLERQGEVVNSDVRIEVGCHPEMSTDQSRKSLTKEIEEFVDDYLEDKEEERIELQKLESDVD